MAPTAPSTWVTVFNGARDGYQVPVALAESGRLEALVTDWYSPLDQPAMSSISALLPRRIRTVLERRFSPSLPSRLVHSRIGEVFRQRGGAPTLPAVDARLGAYAGALARQRAAGLLAYSYYAHAAFLAHGRDARGKILFQVQTHPESLRATLQEEMDLVPESAAVLRQEPELAASTERLHALVEAPRMAELCITPSSYTRRTLMEQGIAADRICVIPYGVDLAQFANSDRRREASFRVLFVGQLTQRKGLKYLLSAWKRLNLPAAELLLVARGHVDEELIRPYAGQFTLMRDVNDRAELARLYASADVFCMPSIADSFGLVFLESLACGTPVIGTDNTGAPDLLAEEAGAGFIVPIRDTNALAERLEWCHTHRDDLIDMRSAARRCAEKFPWSRFRAGIAGAVIPC